MAVKKNAASKTGSAEAATATKATKKVVAKETPSSHSQKVATAKPSVTSATSTKVGTPKVAKSTPSATKKAAARVVAPIKLTERQRDFLKTIWEAKEQGFTTAKKAEQKTIDALLDRKLIKRGAKDKQSGSYRYQVSKAGEKHLSTRA
jgi:hypothetical protein